MSYLQTGTAALQLGVSYHRLVRAIRGRNDLPGVIRVGPNAAFELARLNELREKLVAEGVIPTEPAPAAAVI